MKTRNEFKIARYAAILFPLVLFMLLLASCGKNKEPEGSVPDKNSIAPATSENMVFTEVDNLPVFNGGDTALLGYLARNTTYPADAKTTGVQGKVITKFIVERDGSVSGVEVLKGVSPSIDAEAIRVVSSLPKFSSAAKKDGKTVRVYYMVPIMFTLR